MGKEQPPDPSSKDDFAMWYIQNQGRVYAYIATLVPNRSDAEDLLQRTSLVMWQKLDQFDQRFGYLAWARGIALNEIRNHWRRKERQDVHLSDEVLSMLADEVEVNSNDQKLEALNQCLAGLEQGQRNLLEQCYLESAGTKSAASSLNISLDAVYMRLHRIRRSLVLCIEKRIGQSGPHTGKLDLR